MRSGITLQGKYIQYYPTGWAFQDYSITDITFSITCAIRYYSAREIPSVLPLVSEKIHSVLPVVSEKIHSVLPVVSDNTFSTVLRVVSDNTFIITCANYASPSSGEAYRDRRLTTNFELWVEIFCVPTCFHMRIPKPCLSVRLSVCTPSEEVTIASSTLVLH